MPNKLKDTIYMTLIDPTINARKFYEMTDLGTGEWRAHWGRIGTKGGFKDFPMDTWNEKFDEKTKEGYEVQSRTPNTSMPSTAPKPIPVPAPATMQTAPKPAKVDKDQQAKLDTVSSTVRGSKKSAETFDLNLLNSIRRNFVKTGVLSADDMIKLNTLYKKYKI